ncbi:nicotinate-nucleotide adenylyltransferase [Mycoplasmopsis opalescens]|uniref:nicotinate-nucleotide adenylyltransferase n=1 Tax=Mycoplasmopsis opalescens TaxID=114886 RepID=UPI0004A74BA2|nr:nicotinate-nucleotide adenylyltransferase [Mycoplasmopsis opalescens]
MRIALFGGSFNPIHEAHIKIAQFAYRELKLDKLIFIPANKNPFKKNKKIEKNEHRINMIKLAISECEENFEISEFETKRGGVSYTFETIRYFKQKYPNDELFFLAGTDTLSTLHKWEFIEEICTLVQFVVFKRSNKFSKVNIKKFNLLVLNNPVYSHSSTNIRQGNLSFLSDKVRKYIGENYLYAFEIVHGILSHKRANHCVKCAEFAAKLAQSLNAKKGVTYINPKRAYIAGLFHDICKELEEDESRKFIYQFDKDAFDKVKYPHYKLHQTAGAYWLKYIYQINDDEIVSAVKKHTSLDFELTTLDKIIYVADKICDGRAYKGVQKLRALALENFEEGFKAVVDLSIQYNLDKGVTFTEEQKQINLKWGTKI